MNFDNSNPNSLFGSNPPTTYLKNAATKEVVEPLVDAPRRWKNSAKVKLHNLHTLHCDTCNKTFGDHYGAACDKPASAQPAGDAAEVLELLKEARHYVQSWADKTPWAGSLIARITAKVGE